MTCLIQQTPWGLSLMSFAITLSILISIEMIGLLLTTLMSSLTQWNLIFMKPWPPHLLSHQFYVFLSSVLQEFSTEERDPVRATEGWGTMFTCSPPPHYPGMATLVRGNFIFFVCWKKCVPRHYGWELEIFLLSSVQALRLLLVSLDIHHPFWWHMSKEEKEAGFFWFFFFKIGDKIWHCHRMCWIPVPVPSPISTCQQSSRTLFP